MKKLSFLEITLVSKIQKRAIRVPFDPRVTILTGQNDTGKSSVIKSLFWTFGADPMTETRWKSGKVISCVKFSIENDVFSMVRREQFFALFNHKNELIKTFTSITNELGPYLAELLDFKLILNNRAKEPVVPPPAFYFLPFYIDQDQSWSKSWMAFTKLGQFPNFKRDVVEYHIGFRPNEYYVAKSTLNKATDEVEKLDSEGRILRGMLTKLSDELSEIEFNIDIEEFKEDTNHLIEECRGLQKKEQKLKEVLVELHNEKLRIEHQTDIIQKAMKQAKLDYRYAANLSEHVDCPTCGAVYENNIAARFEIAMDEGRCSDLLVELGNELSAVEGKLEAENDKHTNMVNEIQKIQSILDRKQGEVILRDVINSQGKAELKSVFKNNIDRITKDLVKKQIEIGVLNERLKNIGDPKRRAVILEQYRGHMRKFLQRLDVQLDEESYSKIVNNISVQGSDLPRAMLAYFFAVAKVMEKYSSSVLAPIVIDSPNQQDQDKIRLDRILTFIKEESNGNLDRQLILGVVELHGVDIPGTIHELIHPYELLREDVYEALNSNVTMLLDKALNDEANRQGSTLSLF